MKRMLSVFLFLLGTIAPAQSNVISGRLFDGVGQVPISGGWVFALASDRKTILDRSMTSTERSANSGGWILESLPPMSGTIILVGFHPATKFNMWTAKVNLTGKRQNLGIVATHMGIPSGGPENADGYSPLKLFFILGWLAQDSLAKQENEQAIELANKLLAAK